MPHKVRGKPGGPKERGLSTLSEEQTHNLGYKQKAIGMSFQFVQINMIAENLNMLDTCSVNLPPQINHHWPATLNRSEEDSLPMRIPGSV